MTHKNQNIAYIYAGLTILCWSTVASVFKIALARFNIVSLLFIANVTALFIYLLIVIFTGRINQIFKGSLISYLRSMLMGFLNPFLYYIVLLRAYSLLPAQIAQPLNFIWPITLTLLAIPFLGYQFSWHSFAGLILSFLGVFFIASRDNITSFKIEEPAGVILALGSSAAWAFYWILNVKDARDNVIKLFMNFFFSAVYISVVLIITGDFQVHLLNKSWPVIYLGIFEMGITFIFWLKALQLAQHPDRIANVIYLTPFISLIIIHFVLGEQIYLTSVIGLFLIVSGIIVQKINHKDEFQEFT
ncbi:MAG TPA: DMT family transporter [Bacteroidales bacterium]|nr:DMT family transporter [Bacteroidales bacterium]